MEEETTAVKQNLLVDARAAAKNELMVATVISKTLEYRSFLAASCWIAIKSTPRGMEMSASMKLP